MALMSESQRAGCWAEYMATFPPGDTCPVLKADLRAMIDVLDQYFSDNAAAINALLPTAARTGLTLPQKARAMHSVIRWRYEQGV